MNLYQVPKAYEAWEWQVEAAAGEVTPELEKALAAIEGSLFEKGASYAALIRNATIEAETCRAEAARWAVRARVAEARRDRLKSVLLAAMKAVGVDKLVAGPFKISLRKANVPAIRWLDTPETLPAGFQKVKIELDGARAHEAYAMGHSLDGFSVEFSEYLIIK